MSRYETDLILEALAVIHAIIHKDDIVMLKKESKVISGKDNPKIGSKYECSGVVTATAISGEVCVNWENGTNNVYRKKDLISCSGGYKSIW